MKKTYLIFLKVMNKLFYDLKRSTTTVLIYRILLMLSLLTSTVLFSDYRFLFLFLSFAYFLAGVFFYADLVDNRSYKFWGNLFFNKYGFKNRGKIEQVEREIKNKKENEALSKYFYKTPNILVFIKAYYLLLDLGKEPAYSEVAKEFIRVSEMKESLPLFTEALLSENAFLFKELEKLVYAYEKDKDNPIYYNLLLKTYKATGEVIIDFYNKNLGSIKYEDRLDLIINKSISKVKIDSLKLDKK